MVSRAESLLLFIAAGIRTWRRRYLILDLVGLIAGLAFGCVAHAWTGRVDVMAASVIVGENVGFYGAAVVRDRVRARRSRSGASSVALLRGLVMEFAPAELLDLALVRPVALVVATRLSGSPVIGIWVGGTVADLAYYVVAGWCARLHSRPKTPNGSLSAGKRDHAAPGTTVGSD